MKKKKSTVGALKRFLADIPDDTQVLIESVVSVPPTPLVTAKLWPAKEGETKPHVVIS